MAIAGTHQTPWVHNDPSLVSIYVHSQRIRRKRPRLLLHQRKMQNLPMRYSRSNIYVGKSCLKSPLIRFSLFSRTPFPAAPDWTPTIHAHTYAQFCVFQISCSATYPSNWTTEVHLTQRVNAHLFTQICNFSYEYLCCVPLKLNTHELYSMRNIIWETMRILLQTFANVLLILQFLDVCGAFIA